MNILYTIRRAEQIFGNNLAIAHESGNRTYREFQSGAKRAASFLLQHARAGDRAAVLMWNGPEYFELYYATAISGVAIVPLNTRWALPDLVFTLNDSGSSMLIVDERFAPLVDPIRAQCPALRTIVYAGAGAAPEGMVDYRAQVAAAPELEDIREPEPDDLAGLFYTSGTTGGPKAAMLSQRNLYSNAMSMLLTDLPPSAIYLHAAPMFHAADLSFLYLSVMRGTTHVFIPTFEPEEFMKTVERYGVTSSTLVPTMVSMVVNHPKAVAYNLSTLKTLTYGASPMPRPLLRRTMELLPQCSFIQAYGMTEMSPIMTMLEPDDHTRQWPDGKPNPLDSAGRPVPGIEIRVVDDRDEDVPVGVAGEILARGANRMLGYWNREEANREVLRGGWMHTGDLGCFDELGFLYIKDRKKDMIKTGGENVYSPEVESVLVGHPAVLEAVVVGVPHEKWGETIRAVAVRRPGATTPVTEEEVIAYCRQRLTHFKCPTSVVFVDILPKGGTGKVQKNVVRQRFGALS